VLCPTVGVNDKEITPENIDHCTDGEVGRRVWLPGVRVNEACLFQELADRVTTGVRRQDLADLDRVVDEEVMNNEVPLLSK
jgi:hypothetical protein